MQDANSYPTERPMPKCIFCDNELTPDTKPEHVLLSALGGRMTTRSAICSEHNNEFGGSVDKALAAQVEIIRNLLQLQSGTKKPPPPLKNLKAGTEKISAFGDGSLRLEVPPFEVTDLPGGRFDVKILVQSEEELHHILPHLAARLRMPLEQVKEQILGGTAAFVERRPDTVHHHLSFGGEDALRSIAKSCLVLLAAKAGSDALKSAAFGEARDFILNGSETFYRNRIHLDARELPCASEIITAFGDLFNLIYVKGDSEGRVIGHFTLYNLVSWRIVLAEAGGVKDVAAALVSDPLNPGTWDGALAVKHDIDFAWLNTADSADLLTRARKRLNAMAERYARQAREREFARIVRDACQKRGITGDADPIPGDKLEEIASEVTARASAHSFGLLYEDTLTRERLRELLRVAHGESE
jgi:HNH endonuclease